MAIKPLKNERELLSQIFNGNHGAFCTLFDHYERFVYGFGRKLTRSDNEAEEIVQEVFLKLWVGRDKFLEIENFEAYLNRLVRNHALNVLRKKVVYTKGIEKIATSTTKKDYSTEQQLEYKEIAKLLENAIANLPEQQKKVYILCHQNGLKYDEAAAELNVSGDTIHYHMKLALKTIREYFSKYAFTYPVLVAFLFK